GIPGVAEIEIHALHAEPLQARFELSRDALGRESVVSALLHRVERLRREHRAVRPARAQPLAEIRLAAAAAVRIGGVECRDPGVPRRIEQLERLLARFPLTEERRRRAETAEVPAAEDDARDRHPR